VLDLGCGIGRLASVLKQRGSGVVGIDFSYAMLKRAAHELDLPVQADATSIPFRSDTFGAVVTSGVLQHLPTDTAFELALMEIARVLRPGGRALFVEGIGHDNPARSSSTTTTVPRSHEDFVRILTPALRLIRQLRFDRVNDPYLVTLWQAQPARSR